jgi:hypothetical protein
MQWGCSVGTIHRVITEGLPKMQQTIRQQKKEIQRLNKWVGDHQSKMWINCVYCGHRYGPDPGTPVAMADILKKHIKVCPKHPCSQQAEEIRRLKSVVAQAAYFAQKGMEEDFVEVSHEGPCTPESGCDGNCMVNANIADHNNRICKLRKAIASVRRK